MQQLFIPNLGAVIMLAQPWTFKLFVERRNETLLEGMAGLKKGEARICNYTNNDVFLNQLKEAGHLVRLEDRMTEEELKNAYKIYSKTKNLYYVDCTLPIGTVLSFDRIYIRRGVESYNSVTFRTKKDCPVKEYRSKRFWAKLPDVNNIVCDIIG